MNNTEQIRGVPHLESFVSKWKLEAFVLVVVIAVLLLFAGQKLGFTIDDAYISFRYAENLANGEGLIYNRGERVEGYTNFLWVILLAFFAKVGIPTFFAAKFLGILCSMLILWVTFRISKMQMLLPSFWSLLAPILLATSLPFSLWAVSGLETGLFTLLTLLGVREHLRELEDNKGTGISSFWFALGTLARPEGLVFGVTSVLHKILVRRSFLAFSKEEIRGIIFLVGILSLFEIWRLLYYGQPLPNTFFAKAGGGLTERVRDGLIYARPFVASLGGVLFFYFIFAGVLTRILNPRVNYLVMLSVALGAAIVWEGGDWMPFFRFFVSLLPVLFLLIAVGLREIAEALKEDMFSINLGRSSITTFSLASAAQFLVWIAPIYVNFNFLTTSSGSFQASQVRWETEGLPRAHIAVGKMLRQTAEPIDTVAVSDAGAIAYFSRLRTIDVGGLNNGFIAKLRYTYGDALFTENTSPEIDNARERIRKNILDQQPRWIVYVSYEQNWRPGEGAPAAEQKHWYQLYKDPRFPELYDLQGTWTHYETAPGRGYYLLLYKRRP